MADDASVDDVSGLDVGLDPLSLNPNTRPLGGALLSSVDPDALTLNPSFALRAPVALNVSDPAATKALTPYVRQPQQITQLSQSNMPPQQGAISLGGPQGPVPLQPAPQIAPQARQTGQPGITAVSPSAWPNGQRPGEGQGMFGSNLTVGPTPGPDVNPDQMKRDIAKAQADRLMQGANKPWFQFWFGATAEKDRQKAMELYGVAGDQDRILQEQKNNQLKADNYGIPKQNQTYTQDDKTIVENAVKGMREGNQSYADALKARGYGALTEGYHADMVNAQDAKLDEGIKVKDFLDKATSDDEYKRLVKELEDPEHPLSSIGIDIPPTRQGWEAGRNKREDDINRAKIAIQQYRQQRVNQNNYVPTTNSELAKIHAGQATYPDGTPMHGIKGVNNANTLSFGGQGPNGSHDITGFGRDWTTWDNDAAKEFDTGANAAYPAAERAKYVGFMQAAALATTNPKTGKPLTEGEQQKEINTNPLVQSAIQEGLTGAFRLGEGGTNGQLMKMALAKLGPVQKGLDDLITAWAGGRAVLTGEMTPYLSKMTQGQIRYVLDFVKNYHIKNAALRLGDAAERAGMQGGKPENLPLDPEIQKELEPRMARGRDKTIQKMGSEYRVIGDNYSVFLGNNPSLAAVPGAKRTPVPPQMLPGLYPELQAPPPAPVVTAPAGAGGPAATGGTRPPAPPAATVVPPPATAGPPRDFFGLPRAPNRRAGGSAPPAPVIAPAPSAAPPVAQPAPAVPAGGGSPFTGGAVPVPFTPAPAMTAPGQRSDAGTLSRIANAIIPAAHAEGAPPVPAALPAAWGAGVGNAPAAPVAPAARPAVAPIGTGNYRQAISDLNLSTQERALYERHLQNLNGPGGVDNPDGSRSTLYQANVEHDGKHYNIPTVYDGKILPVAEAAKRAETQGWDKFPSYGSEKEAEDRYGQMHSYMDRDTGEHFANRRAAAGRPAPAVPTSQSPAGPGTGSSVHPPAVAAPQGARPGGDFDNGVPSNGFPSVIADHGMARTVYGVAGQTAKNAMTHPNPVISTNAAIVTTSAAQSESNFNPNTVHQEKDGNNGYGLFGHRLDRLTGMRQWAGVGPGEPVPANTQTSWYVREMSKMADRDPFIAQTLANPNATAEDLTKVQIRMESPEGYKGPGTEEKASRWTERLAHTRALMGNSAVQGTTQTAAAGGAAPAAAAVPARIPYPNPKSPQEALANYNAGVRQSPEEAAQYQALRDQRLQQATESGAHMQKNLLIGAGGVLGSVYGPVGTAAGGTLGGILGGTIEHAFTAPPEKQNPAGFTEAGAWGGAKGLASSFGGPGVGSMVGRVVANTGVDTLKKWWEGGTSGEIFDAGMKGLAESATGEAFGRGLGLTHQLWNVMSTSGKAELIALGHTLSTQEPKIANAAGKMIDNPQWEQAAERVKQLHQDPDTVKYNYEQTVAKEKAGQTVAPMSEVLAERPSAVAQAKVGREQLDPIRNEVGEAPKPSAAAAPTFKHDPVNMVGNHPDVPLDPKYMQAAANAHATMNAKASNWKEIWNNQVNARSKLLDKAREAEDAHTYVGQQEDIKAYRAMANEVRNQQEHIATKLLGPQRGGEIMAKLDAAHAAYREAKIAGGPDIVKTIAEGGPKGRAALDAFNKLSGNDPAAKGMVDALAKLHGKYAKAAKIGGRVTTGGVIGGAAALAHFIPGVGTMAGLGISAVRGLHLLEQHMLERAAGSTATFKKLITREVSAKTRANYSRASSAVAGPAAREGAGALGSYLQSEDASP